MRLYIVNYNNYGILIWGTAAIKYLNKIHVNMHKLSELREITLDILRYLPLTKN